MEQLLSLQKEQPEIKCGLFYKHSKVYRILVIVSDAQILATILNKEYCLDARNKFERFWSASIRRLWNISRFKLSRQAHWFNKLEY